jgi:hypothetical protein
VERAFEVIIKRPWVPHPHRLIRCPLTTLSAISRPGCPNPNAQNARLTVAIIIAVAADCPQKYTPAENCREALMMPKLFRHVRRESCVLAENCNRTMPRCVEIVPTKPFVCKVPANICGNNQDALNDWFFPLSYQAYRDFYGCYNFIIVQNPTNCPLDDFVGCTSRAADIRCAPETHWKNDLDICFKKASDQLIIPCPKKLS